MELIEQIKSDIKNNSVLLYMKGTKEMPMCGFSSTVVNILNIHEVEYKATNVLENHDIRKIVIDPNDELSFFEGTVVGMLDQRYCEFFRSRFNTDIDEIVRIDILEIIKSYLPDIRKKIS